MIYGRGFYLTENMDLAKEWAVCNPETRDGWVHKYNLNCESLKILDFESLGILAWIAELMKHRAADSSKRYRVLSQKFIRKYGIDTTGYDVIRGWRANASYFYITKAFVRDEIDINILKELFKLGDLGIQYCLKSEKAFQNITEDKSSLLNVDFEEFNKRYMERDTKAREKMRELIDSDKNTVLKVFSTLV